MRRKRRKFSSSFKTEVALAAIKERKTLGELSKHYELHPNQISKWKQEFLSNASSIFETPNKKSEEPTIELQVLYAKIGQLEMEREFLKKSLEKLDRLR